ncbi:unnamed protein product [Lactuca virosa]|uniref:AP2/ERF domain-containing protein n=1 Tax=Lactuca virosa TaxID=75947 RepID=A0AAU9MPW5_9ASTR|nr:unnamed protein product [Lactuca virosa]
MNTDQENLKNLERSGTDELEWSLNLNDFELRLIREIISNGDIATVLQLQHHQPKSPENSTKFPATGTTATPPVDVAMNRDFTAGQCNEMVVSGLKDRRPLLPSLPEKRYRGVSLRRSGKFSAEICSRSRRLWLGTYDTAEEAAMAFDRAAIKERGSHTFLNFPDLIGTLNVSPEKDTNKKLSLWSEGSPESSTNNHLKQKSAAV